jgi:hypothetical protein
MKWLMDFAQWPRYTQILIHEFEYSHLSPNVVGSGSTGYFYLIAYFHFRDLNMAYTTILICTTIIYVIWKLCFVVVG